MENSLRLPEPHLKKCSRSWHDLNRDDPVTSNLSEGSEIVLEQTLQNDDSSNRCCFSESEWTNKISNAFLVICVVIFVSFLSIAFIFIFLWIYGIISIDCRTGVVFSTASNCKK